MSTLHYHCGAFQVTGFCYFYGSVLAGPQVCVQHGWVGLLLAHACVCVCLVHLRLSCSHVSVCVAHIHKSVCLAHVSVCNAHMPVCLAQNVSVLLTSVCVPACLQIPFSRHSSFTEGRLFDWDKTPSRYTCLRNTSRIMPFPLLSLTVSQLGCSVLQWGYFLPCSIRF